MPELPPDLPQLRTLRTWHQLCLTAIDRAIADLERRERERETGRRRRPPAPDWVIELGIGTGPPVAVHAGDCYMIGKRRKPLDRDQAIRALGEHVGACIHCRPDTELGVLD
ncbi:DUF6233 domain-containing protein [Streptomyces sp. NPDC060194]|uniref:DUF6233 domain-containing protein n=1 Tax=Streptomyces sp. NPDC060194 TaxID=3347069 RepID=UPI0036579C9B